MFNVYPPEKYNCSSPINPVEFLCETWTYAKELYPQQLQPKALDNSQREQEIRNIMNVTLTDDNWEKLVDYCNPGNLNENTPFLKEMTLNDKTKMDCEGGKKFKTVTKRKQLDSYYKQNVNSLSIYRSNVHLSSMIEIPLNASPDIIPGEDVLINIRIYEPIILKSKKKSKFKFSSELVVLGSHTLDVLRDNIRCPNDLGVRYDMSDCPFETNLMAKEAFKSGFLYIENTFYNDMRDSANIDYSECIRNWAKSKPDIGPFNTAVMEDTAFHQLPIRFGYPQVYQHQGDCEHIFVFSNIEIVKPFDLPYFSSYPICKSKAKRNAQLCTICGKYGGKWVVTNSDRVPFDPALFCNVCFYNYNYSNGKKIGNFKAFPYNSVCLI